MANQYVLADKMFSSSFDSTSFMSHQFIIAGVNPEKTIGIPQTGWWGCPGGKSDPLRFLACTGFGRRDTYVRVGISARSAMSLMLPASRGRSMQRPLGGSPPCTLRAQGIDGDGSGAVRQTEAVSGAHIRRSRTFATIKRQWDTHILTPPKRFLKDIGRGKLSSVTWITPTWVELRSRRAVDFDTGPSWVTSVVNAIGESQYWNSTAIFIFWDDYGGWFDPEAPTYVDLAGLGMRLPLLIISPYARKGYVDHTHFEHGTILKFVENIFGLPRLTSGGSDVRANPPDDAFDFSKPPRKFVPIKAPLDANYFIHERLDGQPPDSD